jgi:hypothetical protein
MLLELPSQIYLVHFHALCNIVIYWIVGRISAEPLNMSVFQKLNPSTRCIFVFTTEKYIC